MFTEMFFRKLTAKGFSILFKPMPAQGYDDNETSMYQNLNTRTLPMKTRVNFIISFVLIATLLYPQVKITVKCNGSFSEREYRSYDECNCKWWVVQYFKDGVKDGIEFSKSRERVLEVAEHWCRRWSQWERKTYTHGEPYCDDMAICNPLNKDFISHFSSLHTSWELATAEAFARYKEYEGIGLPSVGSMMIEWASELQESVRRAGELKEMLDSYMERATNELAAKIKEFESAPTQFQSRSDYYENKIKELIKKEKKLPEKKPEKAGTKTNGNTIEFSDSGQKNDMTRTKIKSKKEMEAEEKINETMIKKLEEDFDKEKRTKVIKPDVKSAEEAPEPENTSTVINSSSNPKTSVLDGYKNFIIEKLNNYKFITKTTSIFGITSIEEHKLENLHWESNTLHYTTIVSQPEMRKEIRRGDYQWNFSKNGKSDRDHLFINKVQTYLHPVSVSQRGQRVWTLMYVYYGEIYMVYSDSKPFIESLEEAFTKIIAASN